MAGGDRQIDFRPLARDDLPRLRRWLNAPPADDAATAAKYGPMIDGDDRAEMFVFAVDGREAGVAQRYLIDEEPEWCDALAVALDASGMAGIDYLIGEPDLVGEGIGPGMIGAFVRLTFERYPACRAIVVDVDPQNRASWRALEKAGMRRIFTGQVLDEGELAPAHLYRLDRPDAGLTAPPPT